MSAFANRLTLLLTALGVVLLGAATLAPAAPARTLVVNTLEDNITEEACGTPTATCSLRDAIDDADENTEADTIEFSVAGSIKVEEVPLPWLEGPLTIDATTAPGYAGAPVVEIDGKGAESEGGEVAGLHVFQGAATIEGLAIGNFSRYGIFTESKEPVQICADRIGTGMVGTTAEPNGIGIGTSATAAGTRIGAECPAGAGNLISGNERFGISDAGTGTEMAANRIGIDALGGPLPNGAAEEEAVTSPSLPGGAGIEILGTARFSYVGPHDGEAGNTVAFNDQTGVLVRQGAETVTIAGNSIHSNAGAGIADEAPTTSAPLLSAARSGLAETAVDGTLAAAPGEGYVVEFFASPACDPSGSGEGQTPLGGEALTTDAAGNVAFAARGLDPAPPGQPVITATATPIGPKGSTSVFSRCLTAGPFPSSPSPPPGRADAIAPENGQTVVVEPASGTILVKLPGEKKFKKLTAGEAIPVGSVIDATNGKVTLTSIDAQGNTQTAVFYGGIFQVFQSDGKSLVILKLRGGDFSSCGAKGAASASKKAGRHLWGSGKGDFRSEGKHGSATVRGTIWLTEDRCDGTFFKVRRGVVSIRDFDAARTLKLTAGKSYLAD